MTEYPRTPRTTLRRRRQRGTYDRATVHAILDEAIFCHVATQTDHGTVCLPMVFVRIDEALYLHGSPANHVLCALRDGAQACLTVTFCDGLVLGRSAFRTSVNYRSVVAFATATEITDPREKTDVLNALVEHVIPGRWADVRRPSADELRTTLVLRLPLTEVSAKVRTGPPQDDEADYERACWGGVIPLQMTAGAPIADARVPAGMAPPAYAQCYTRGVAEGAASLSAGPAA